MEHEEHPPRATAPREDGRPRLEPRSVKVLVREQARHERFSNGYPRCRVCVDARGLPSLWPCGVFVSLDTLLVLNGSPATFKPALPAAMSG